jgi:hypothetical protein
MKEESEWSLGAGLRRLVVEKSLVVWMFFLRDDFEKKYDLDKISTKRNGIVQETDTNACTFPIICDID